MPQLPAPVIPEGINLTENDALLNDAFFGDADFAKATFEGMAAFAEGKETILLEELRAEVA